MIYKIKIIKSKFIDLSISILIDVYNFDKLNVELIFYAQKLAFRMLPLHKYMHNKLIHAIV